MLKVEEKPLLVLIEDDLGTMMHDHWRECSCDQDEVPFDPDWDGALLLEKAGTLRTYALFEDGELAGYASFEVSSHLHFKSTRHAFGSALYVRPESRRGNAAAKLLTEVEKLLKAAGVKKIFFSSPCHSVLCRLLEKAGFVPRETCFTKMVA